MTAYLCSVAFNCWRIFAARRIGHRLTPWDPLLVSCPAVTALWAWGMWHRRSA